MWPDWTIFCALGNFSKPVQKLFCPNCSHLLAIFVKVSKSFIFCKGVENFHFSLEIILGNFYRHLATFYWSHCRDTKESPERRKSREKTTMMRDCFRRHLSWHFVGRSKAFFNAGHHPSFSFSFGISKQQNNLATNEWKYVRSSYSLQRDSNSSPLPRVSVSSRDNLTRDWSYKPISPQ